MIQLTLTEREVDSIAKALSLRASVFVKETQAIIQSINEQVKAQTPAPAGEDKVPD